jgi:hypothetical protein
MSVQGQAIFLDTDGNPATGDAGGADVAVVTYGYTSGPDDRRLGTWNGSAFSFIAAPGMPFRWGGNSSAVLRAWDHCACDSDRPSPRALERPVRRSVCRLRARWRQQRSGLQISHQFLASPRPRPWLGLGLGLPVLLRLHRVRTDLPLLRTSSCLSSLRRVQPWSSAVLPSAKPPPGSPSTLGLPSVMASASGQRRSPKGRHSSVVEGAQPFGPALDGGRLAGYARLDLLQSSYGLNFDAHPVPRFLRSSGCA